MEKEHCEKCYIKEAINEPCACFCHLPKLQGSFYCPECGANWIHKHRTVTKNFLAAHPMWKYRENTVYSRKLDDDPWNYYSATVTYLAPVPKTPNY